MLNIFNASTQCRARGEQDPVEVACMILTALLNSYIT